MKALWLLAFACGVATAAPFVPTDADEVVERLPSRLVSPAERDQQRALQQRRAAAPTQLPVALQAARAAIDRARRSGDPRELGEAQAALAPWWSLTDPPSAVRLLRATVRQSQHQFDAALRDLDVLAANAPLEQRAQAVLTRTAVLQVTGRWAEAEASCRDLGGAAFAPLGPAVSMSARVCRAELASLRGATAPAAADLAALSRATRDDGLRRWVDLVRSELAERSGDPHAGDRYREALGDTPDLYTLAALADWLLARDRPADVLPLLAGREDADALLLRLAIARVRTRDPAAAATTRLLADRFDAAALREDTAHRREQARFELDVRGDARAALPHAVANWAVQKEPADALLLVRVAAAAGEPRAAAPVWAFVREQGLADVRLGAARDGATR